MKLRQSLSVALGALAILSFAATSCADVASPVAHAREVAPRAVTLPSVYISELHYDNTGTDAGEAIEITGPAGTSVEGWTLVLYNGSTGQTYDTDALSGTIPATCGSRGVVVLQYPSNGIQNGAPDGIALVDASGAVVEFLSYEGTFAAVNGPAAGATPIDIGRTQTGSEPLGSSIFRSSDGSWTKSSATAPASFGACNDAGDPPPVVVDRVVVTPATASVNEGGTQQFTATAFDAANAELSGVTFAWTSSASSIANVDATGLATGVGAGTADIRASAGGRTGAATLDVIEAPIPNLPAVRFSEIHYDNVGTDVGEFVEVEGPAGTDLTGWSVVLYNGSNGASYHTAALAGAISAQCAGRGVVVVRYEQDGIQNAAAANGGEPDGMALVNGSGAVVEFLSYEGTFTATDGAAAGMTSTDIGVVQTSAPHFRTLQRRVSGRWDVNVASTQGGCLGSTPVTPVNQVSFSGRVPFDAPLPVGFEDQLFGTLRSPTDATISTTFTWESLTPDIATIESRGVIRALAAGNATFRATAADGTTGTFTLPMAVATASTTALYGNHAEFGEPADGDASDDYLLRRTEFTSSFNRVRNIPNWVSYNLDATHITSGQDRCDCFTYDPLLPAEFSRYTTADYTGAGAAAGFGIDRGHLARSFDRTSGALDNARTFYFSNIIPQAADNNQGPWANFENHLGNLAQNENAEVYIVTGASGSQGTVKDEGLITIPTHVWKVAVIMTRDAGLADVDRHDDVEIIAVIMPNIAGIRNVDWNTYRTTVNAVEALSGYDLLALLPDAVEGIVESELRGPMSLVDKMVAAGALSAGNGRSLQAKLEAAAASLERGNTTSMRNQLEAFVREVDALERSRRVNATDAGSLRDALGPLLGG